MGACIISSSRQFPGFQDPDFAVLLHTMQLHRPCADTVGVLCSLGVSFCRFVFHFRMFCCAYVYNVNPGAVIVNSPWDFLRKKRNKPLTGFVAGHFVCFNLFYLQHETPNVGFGYLYGNAE